MDQMSNELKKCLSHCSTMKAFDGKRRSISLRMVLQKALLSPESSMKTVPWYWANHNVIAHISEKSYFMFAQWIV